MQFNMVENKQALIRLVNVTVVAVRRVDQKHRRRSYSRCPLPA